VKVLSEEQKERQELRSSQQNPAGRVKYLIQGKSERSRFKQSTKSRPKDQLNRMIKQVIEDEIKRAEAAARKKI